MVMKLEVGLGLKLEITPNFEYKIVFHIIINSFDDIV